MSQTWPSLKMTSNFSTYLERIRRILPPYIRASPTKIVAVRLVSPVAGVHPLPPGRMAFACSSLLETFMLASFTQVSSAKPSLNMHGDSTKSEET